jgi:hypothetical protein
MPATECGSCHQEVWFCEKFPAELNDRGLPKTVPVNADSIYDPADPGKGGDPRGTMEVWSERIPTDGGSPLWALFCRYLNQSHPSPAPGHKRAVSHFATCPQAGQWRSRQPSTSRRS